jgi:flagellar assembly protein FliH
MRTRMTLESFDPAEMADEGPSPDYQDGYRAGFTAATDAANDAADRLSHDLVQTLTDMTFTYREAQQDVMESLAVLVSALVDSVLPHCVAAGMTRQIADLILVRHSADQGKGITVHVHPSQLRAVRDATAEIGDIVIISPDPSLTPHTAWIGQGGVATFLDMDGHLAEIDTVLSNLIDCEKRIMRNG